MRCSIRSAEPLRPDERSDVRRACIGSGSSSRLSQTGLRPRPARTRCRGRHRRPAAAAWRAQVGEHGLVVLSDINAAMLRGRSRPPARSRHPAQRCASRSRTRSVCRSATSRLRLRDHRVRAPQRHGQARGARLHVPRAATRRPAAGARVLAAGDSRALKPLYDAYSFARAAAGSASASRATRRATVISRNRSAASRTRRRCSAMMRDAGLEDCRYHNLSGGIVALHQRLSRY